MYLPLLFIFTFLISKYCSGFDVVADEGTAADELYTDIDWATFVYE